MAASVRVNRLLDFIERVGWTAIQAAAAAVLTALAAGADWTQTLTFVGLAALAAACKVIVAQRVGKHGSGDAIPGGVIETH